MPKYAIHHIVLQEAARKLSESSNSAAKDSAKLINDNLGAAILGSIGPDLFFWGPDYTAMRYLYKLYENYEKIKNIYNKIVEPIKEVVDAVGEPVEKAVESLAPNTINLIKYTLGQIKNTSTYFESAVMYDLFSGVLTGANLISDAAGVAPLSYRFFAENFTPEFQKDISEDKKAEKNWYWFDMLHYRRTGVFAKNLFTSATTSDFQKAYALGYLSHIATDVTGHGYVNQVSGTSYRLHVQRHVTIENFMDTWKYYQYYNESINNTLFDKFKLEQELSPEFARYLANAFKSTYADPCPHPTEKLSGGFYTEEHIQQTYTMFYKVLELLGGMYIKKPEEPFSGVADILSEALESFSPPPSLPQSSTSNCDWSDIFFIGLTDHSKQCYENFFKEIETWLNYLGELLKWSFETLRNLIDLVGTLLASLPITVLLAILYGIQMLCYNIYRTARSVLSINGFVTPEPDELDSSIGQYLTTPVLCGGLIVTDPDWVKSSTFPKVLTGRIASQSHLICLGSKLEQPTTFAAFHPVAGPSLTTPDRFIHHEPFNEQNIERYATCKKPKDTQDVELNSGSIGNSVDFTAWMIQNAFANSNENLLYTNWNLDADRGYGYHTWSGKIPHTEPFTVTEEKYNPEEP
jgi:hypothetical protein